jgi:hypothetical protein
MGSYHILDPVPGSENTNMNKFVFPEPGTGSLPLRSPRPPRKRDAFTN